MLGLSSSIIFFIAILTPPLLTKASQSNCSYSIEIETTCASSAGTKDVIDVRFSDKTGNLVIVKNLKNPKLGVSKSNQGSFYNGFERCAIGTFETSGTCMSEVVCSLYVKKFGSDEWRPGWVKVLHKGGAGRVSLVSYVFYFRTFVPENVWFGHDYCGSSRGYQKPHVASLSEET